MLLLQRPFIGHMLTLLHWSFFGASLGMMILYERQPATAVIREDLAYVTVRDLVGEVLDHYVAAGGSSRNGARESYGGGKGASPNNISAFKIPVCGSGG
jgi:hypothetical protein